MTGLMVIAIVVFTVGLVVWFASRSTRRATGNGSGGGVGYATWMDGGGSSDSNCDTSGSDGGSCDGGGGDGGGGGGGD